MKILFICKHNKFRSKVSESIFNQLNKNKKILAESAGLIGSDHPTPESVVNVLMEKGYDLKDRIARRVDSSKINNYDLLVIVADNVDPAFFKNSFNGEIIWWKITDCIDTDIPGIRKRVDEIEEKVKVLARGFN
ncbi:Protein ArsC [uncultured archaeon]|nr:Protein ArsC [uncultured archaeon]